MNSLFVAFALHAPVAWAGDLEIRSTGAAVVVMRGTTVAGTTPLLLKDLPEGAIELGFRETPLGATVFSQKVQVPASGTVALEVNLPQRTAVVAAPTAPVLATLPPAAAPAAAPAPAAPPAPAKPAGDIYVTSTPPGAAIWLDGKDSGLVTPNMIRGVDPGKHLVQVRTDCTRAQVELTVANGVIARAELVPEEGKGEIKVGKGPEGSMVFIDGVQAGKAPGSFREQSCGEHTVAIRAPGYLEQSSTVKLPAFETLTVEVALKKEEFGTLVVDITPLEASVKVDGIDVGVGPRSLERIATGPHTVEGSSNGYHPLTLDLTVEPDQVTRANLSLIPLSQSLEPPKPEKEAGPVARIVLNSAVSLLGLGSTSFGVARFTRAASAFQEYQLVSSNEEADRIYAEEVVPMRTQAYIFGGTGIALLGGSAVLWATTKF